jgi:hypothetical protein
MWAAELKIPLNVDYMVLDAAIRQRLYTGAGGAAPSSGMEQTTAAISMRQIRASAAVKPQSSSRPTAIWM